MPYRLAIAHCFPGHKARFLEKDKKRGWVMGLEPMISRTTIWRANQLHHTHHVYYSSNQASN